jgi:hypothetical protein
MSGQKIIDGLQEAIAAERYASDVCKLDLQARIDAIEAQIAAADRLATAAMRVESPSATSSAWLALADAIAAYRAARVQP